MIRFWYAVLAVELVQLAVQAIKDEPSWLGVVAILMLIFVAIGNIESLTPRRQRP